MQDQEIRVRQFKALKKSLGNGPALVIVLLEGYTLGSINEFSPAAEFTYYDWEKAWEKAPYRSELATDILERWANSASTNAEAEKIYSGASRASEIEQKMVALGKKTASLMSEFTWVLKGSPDPDHRREVFSLMQALPNSNYSEWSEASKGISESNPLFADILREMGKRADCPDQWFAILKASIELGEQNQIYQDAMAQLDATSSLDDLHRQLRTSAGNGNFAKLLEQLLLRKISTPHEADEAFRYFIGNREAQNQVVATLDPMEAEFNDWYILNRIGFDGEMKTIALNKMVEIAERNSNSEIPLLGFAQTVKIAILQWGQIFDQAKPFAHKAELMHRAAGELRKLADTMP